MEDIYYSIIDNIIEFISINPSLIHIFEIHSSSKILFSHFDNLYNLTIDKHLSRKPILSYLKRFKQLTRLIFNIDPIQEDISWNDFFLDVNRLNDLRIKSKNYSTLPLENLIHLTSLCLKIPIRKGCYFHYDKILKLTSLSSVQDKKKFKLCHNLEELYVNVHLKYQLNYSFLEFEFSKLTKLTINSYFSCPSEKQNFDLSLFQNIIELNIASVNIKFENYNLPRLTGLTILNIYQGVNIRNMSRLNRLYLSRGPDPSQINIDVNNLTYLRIRNYNTLCFQNISLFGISNQIIFQSDMSKLLSLNMITNAYCDILYADKIEHVKNIKLNNRIFDDINSLMSYLNQEYYTIIRKEIVSFSSHQKENTQHLMLIDNVKCRNFNSLKKLKKVTIVGDIHIVPMNNIGNIDCEYISIDECKNRYMKLLKLNSINI